MRCAPGDAVIVLRNIATHFPARSSEWIMGVGLTCWGASLLTAQVIFASNPNFAGMAALGQEETWGAVAVAAGLMRLLALFVNGTYQSFRHSPHMRAATGGVACFVWCSIWIALMASPTARIAYGMLLAIEINNVWRAGADAGAQKAAQYGSGS